MSENIQAQIEILQRELETLEQKIANKPGVKKEAYEAVAAYLRTKISELQAQL